jgi:hypothetical protein
MTLYVFAPLLNSNPAGSSLRLQELQGAALVGRWKIDIIPGYDIVILCPKTVSDWLRCSLWESLYFPKSVAVPSNERRLVATRSTANKAHIASSYGGPFRELISSTDLMVSTHFPIVSPD